MTKPAKRWNWVVAVTVLTVILTDVVTKALTHHYLPLMADASPRYPYGGIGVFKNVLGIEFSISHTTNTGAAWGAFSGWQDLLVAFRILLIVGLVLYLRFFNRHKEHTLPLVLVVTGAFCNVLDTFIYGHVVDMFHFVLWGYDYPVFNVADATIFIGILCLLLSSFFGQRACQECREP